jgi:glutamine synthetase
MASVMPSPPALLEEALGALKRDHEFLLRGDVFTRDLVDTWVSYKTEHEVNEVRSRPVP